VWLSTVCVALLQSKNLIYTNDVFAKKPPSQMFWGSESIFYGVFLITSIFKMALKL